MTRILSIGTRILAAMVLVTVFASHAAAQGTTANKQMFLTFSGAVQVPGATLPKGTYVFRLADPATQHVWQVLDKSQQHVLAQFFYVRTPDRSIAEADKADGKPVVRFHETAQGVTPAIKIVYYPADLAGAEFLYPKAQAATFASVAPQTTIATTK